MCVSQAGGTSRWRQVSKGAGGRLAGNSDGGASVFVLEVSGWPFAVDPAPHTALGRTAELLKNARSQALPQGSGCLGSHQKATAGNPIGKVKADGLGREDQEGDMETSMWGQIPCHSPYTHRVAVEDPCLQVSRDQILVQRDVVL